MSHRLRGVAAALLLAVTSPARADVVNRIIATIDGEPVTQHELDQFTRDRQAEKQDRATILEAFITDKLLAKEVKAAGIDVKPPEVDQAIAELRTQNKMNEAEFAKALQAQGFTTEAFRRKIKEELERNELVNREVRGRVNVSPQEIERYYEAHKGDYAGGDKVTLSDILLRPSKDDPGEMQKVAEMAKRVATEARAGNFAEVARRYSMAPSAADGGLLGTFQKNELDARLSAVAFKMKVGDVSDPIPTSTGIHIIRVEQFSGGGGKDSPRKLDEVKDEIREELYKQQIGTRFQEFLGTKLRERHHVEMLD